jgi:hypothetical protein
MKDDRGLANTIETTLAEAMTGLFDLVVSDRRARLVLNPFEIPDQKSAPSIFRKYSAINAAFSGLA